MRRELLQKRISRLEAMICRQPGQYQHHNIGKQFFCSVFTCEGLGYRLHHIQCDLFSISNQCPVRYTEGLLAKAFNALIY